MAKYIYKDIHRQLVVWTDAQWYAWMIGAMTVSPFILQRFVPIRRFGLWGWLLKKIGVF